MTSNRPAIRLTALHSVALSAFFLLLPAAKPAVAQTLARQAPTLTLPIDCALGKECFVQNFVDIDPSKAVLDPACGQASYNGHKGTDFSLLTMSQMAQGVKVIAALPGRVIGIRQTMPDRLVKNPFLARAVKGKECGNGIMVQHENGWQTQYCHLRQGSIIVRKGAMLKRGQTIGLVGLSGMTQFPHVHLGVRHNKKVIDPFTGKTPSQSCISPKGAYGKNPQSLWHKDVQSAFPKRTFFMRQAGFSDHKVSRKELRTKPPNAPTSVHAAALVLYAGMANLQKGDRLQLQIYHGQDRIFHHISKPLQRKKARYMSFAGKKKPAGNWKAGPYKGIIRLIRHKKVVLTKRLKMTLR